MTGQTILEMITSKFSVIGQGSCCGRTKAFALEKATQHRKRPTTASHTALSMTESSQLRVSFNVKQTRCVIAHVRNKTKGHPSRAVA